MRGVDRLPGRAALLAIVLALVAACASSGRPSAPAATAATAPQSSAPTTAAPGTSAPGRTASLQPPGRSSTTSAGSETAGRPDDVHYVFPVAGCSVSYGRSHHDYPATDIFAARGCAFVAPVDGRVDEVNRVDRWDPAADPASERGGLSVSLVGVDGVRYYGSHLMSIAPGVAPGIQVRAGRALGRVGNTGNARGTGSHLHFGISWPTPKKVWWVRRGVLYPWPYLDAWRRGRDRSPAAAVRAARARAGTTVPPCSAAC
jgi:peptidoglycan LD-endopeptidase LytH